jgi:hypothetical protein
MKIPPEILAASAASATIGIIALVGIGNLPYTSQGKSVPAYAQIIKLAEVSDGDGEADDAQESAKLKSLAKITALQAKQSAEANSGGSASSIKLENKDGNLLYAVIIGQTEVKVDAGNGRVLYTKAVNSQDETTKHPNSSIRVSDQGDGETDEDRKYNQLSDR